MQYLPNSVENAYVDRQILQLRRDLITELNQFSYKVENYVNTQIRSSQDAQKIGLSSSLNNLYERIKSDIVDEQIKIESKLLESINANLEEQLQNKISREIKKNIDTNIKAELDKKIYEQVQQEINYKINYVLNKEIKKQISLSIENQLVIERKIIQKEYEDKIKLIENSYQNKLDNIIKYNIAREQELVANFASIFETMMQKYITKNHLMNQPQLDLGIYPMPYSDFVGSNEINEIKKEIVSIDKPSTINHISNELETIKLNSSAPEFVPKYLKK